MNAKSSAQKLLKKFHALEENFSSRSFEEAAEIFYRLRYIIGGIFLLLCVLLEVHGSSIGLYAKFLDHPELDINLVGVSRPIRSDEYIVFTPFAFAQYFTNFAMISDVIRGTATNVFVIFGQPIQHLAMIFRPAQLGYLLFDQGSGLAFFWVSRLVVLFLISFEFAQKILIAKRSVSLLYAVMVTFSPFAQWWWAINSIAEILATGQGLVLCWKFYLAQRDGKRFFFAAGVLWCAGIFFMSIYPAWQVPFGWTFLMCAIAVTADFSGVLENLRRDKIFWLVGVLVTLAPIFHVIYLSQDVIQIVRATEYPGTRFVLGGDWNIFVPMFYAIVSLLPFVDTLSTGIINNTGISSFFSATPLGLIVFAVVTVRRKQFDLLITLLVVLNVLFVLWAMFGVPAWLAKVTLMSTVTTERARHVVDYVNMLILFRGLSLTELNFSRVEKIILAGVIAILGTVSIYVFLPDWLGAKKIFVITIFNFTAIYLFAGSLSNLRVGILIAMMLLIGATVNPIARGVDCVYKIPVGEKIAEIARNDKSLWLVEGYGLQDFPIMFGAPTINSVNVYPVLDRWQKLDPTGANLPVYNRYAHITVLLGNDATQFHLDLLDAFTLKLNPADLSKLDVRYIFSRDDDLEKFSSSAVKISKLYEEAGSYIYAVTYKN